MASLSDFNHTKKKTENIATVSIVNGFNRRLNNKKESLIERVSKTLSHIKLATRKVFGFN